MNQGIGHMITIFLHPGASKNSYHVDGLAADFQLSDFQLNPGEKPPQKCEILAEANLLVGGNGEVLDEGKGSVHIAIPTPGDNSRDRHQSGWRCQ